MSEQILRLNKQEIEEIVLKHLQQQGYENIELFTYTGGISVYQKDSSDD